jgi:transcriptional regulator with XRE-family HTH domain
MKDFDENDVCGGLGKNIKKYRTRNAWSQEQLAAKIDISATFLSNVETGRAWISAKTIAKLCNVFKIDISELFMRDEKITVETASFMDKFVRDMSNSVCNSIADIYQAYKKGITVLEKDKFMP